MVTLSLVEEITSALECDQNATRIKKLLVCACRRQWLNDPAALARLSGSDLLIELYHSNASLDQLSETLFSVVKQLSRKAEYVQVAGALLNHCKPLYSDRAETTQFTPADTESTQFLGQTPAPDRYAAVADSLTAHPEVLRLRKLLYCATYGEWENDKTILNQVNLADLLAVLVSHYPSADYLQVALHEIVQSLNRRQQYEKFAAAVLEAIAPLYATTREATAAASDAVRQPNTLVTDALATPAEPITEILPPATPPAAEPVTRLVQRPAIATPPSADPAAQATEVMAYPTASYRATDLQAEPPTGDDTTSYTPANTATDFIATPQLPTNPLPTTHRTYDAFSVRLEVMKYANPLRAKILAFSTLHHKFEVTGNEWSSMRTRPFDDLLANLYETYERAEDLAAELYETAQYLDALDEDQQAAEAIVKALEPFYGDRAPLAATLARA